MQLSCFAWRKPGLLIYQFDHDFYPVDVIEASLVRELAVLTWKRLLLQKLESDYFLKKQKSPIMMDELTDCGLKQDSTFGFEISGFPMNISIKLKRHWIS